MKNQIQLQKGLSLSQFIDKYGTEEQCRESVERYRWPEGFVCSKCGHNDALVYFRDTVKVFQCRNCRAQTTLTEGTNFHSTKLLLTIWFQAIFFVTQNKNHISALELKRHLGVCYRTAWRMKQKLMQVMHEREAKRPLQGRVELDDAYLGGERRGKRGRGAAGKTPVVAAVETTAERRPKKLKLLPVKGFRQGEVEKLARAHLLPGSNVVSDGLSCWGAVERAGCRHFPMVTGSGRQAARWAPFKWVNTTLGTIKAAITGTYRQLSPAHAPRYLASFAWRFNRRFQLDSMLLRLVHSAARTQPLPYRLLIAG